MVQCLRLHVSTAGGACPIPGQGTKILHALQCSQKVKKKTQQQQQKKNQKKYLNEMKISSSPVKEFKMVIKMLTDSGGG